MIGKWQYHKPVINNHKKHCCKLDYSESGEVFSTMSLARPHWSHHKIGETGDRPVATPLSLQFIIAGTELNWQARPDRTGERLKNI